MVESVVHLFVGPKLEKLKYSVQIKQRMQAARDRQKSYANLKRKLMEFQVGDKVMLKVSPWKGVVRLMENGELKTRRYVGPFKVLRKVGEVAYKLELPEELSRVHNTFHVSNLKKCYADEPLAVPLDGLHFDDKLQFVEEPVEIVDREVKRLKRSRIPLIKFFGGVTNLQNSVIDLVNIKTAQAQEITSLKLRVKKLEKKGGSRTHKLKRLYKVGRSARIVSSDEASLEGLGEEDASKQGRIPDIDVDAGISLVSTHFNADTDMFGVHDLVGDEVVVESEVAAKDVNLNVDEVTLAQALAALKSIKPKAKVIVFREPGEPTTATTHTTTIHVPKQSHDKGKGIMVEELMMPKKKRSNQS
ncbi:hypothetical protein Tco_0138287 [Tanacetum coccineum]